jgi:hypothetical protein
VGHHSFGQMAGGSIRRAVAEGRTEDLRRLLQTPENIAHINDQASVSPSFSFLHFPRSDSKDGATALMATIRSTNGVKCLELLLENGADQSIVDYSVLLPSWLDIRSDSLYQDSSTAYDLAEDFKNDLIKNLLDPQFSRLGLMTTTICLNDLEKLTLLLQKRDIGKRINDHFPFSISLHQQFLGTPEAHDNGSHLWSEVTTLLRCAAFLNRVDCLIVLKDKGANMVSVL